MIILKVYFKNIYIKILYRYIYINYESKFIKFNNFSDDILPLQKIDYVKETMVNTEINKLLVNGLMKIPGNLEVTGEIKSCTASGNQSYFKAIIEAQNNHV